MAYTNIDKGSDYFETVTYTGTGAEQSISSLNFSPDLTWIKNRDTTDSHQLVDSVRGATKNLFSNLTNAEATDAEGLKSFDTDGFTVGTRLGMNTSGESYVGWSWRGSDSSAVSNTDGDITSTVSVNQTSGFSIVKWNTGGQPSSTTVSIGHGLNAVPKFFIVKNLPSVEDWFVYHNSLGNTKSILLNSTNAEFTNSDIWGSTTPTSSVFSINTAEWGVSTNDKITYCFAEKKGFSKFGSYTGNGNADGTFIYTGFKPAYVLTKRTDVSDNWVIQDNKQSPFNPTYDFLLADSSGIPTAGGTPIDLLSNGFKVRTTSAYSNASGGTYIYMAFAEQPLVGTNNIPATAR